MFSLTIDRDLEIKVDATIKVTSPPAAAVPLVTLSATCGGITITHTGATKMSYKLPADKIVGLAISYVDANGNPAVIDGAVTWESSDDEIATIAGVESNPPDETNSHVMLVPGTKVGQCQISAKADADLGQGVRELITLLDVEVVGGEAVAGTITPEGEPQPKP